MTEHSENRRFRKTVDFFFYDLTMSKKWIVPHRSSKWGKASSRISRAYRRHRARKAVDRRQDRQISKIKNQLNYSKERKFFDQAADYPFTSAWTAILPRDFTFIAAGTTDNERVGNKIKFHSHHVKIKVTCGDEYNLYRILIVRFPSQSASLVDLADALENPGGTSPFNLMSFKKRNSDTKYQILWDSGAKNLAGNGSHATTGYNSPYSGSTNHMYDIKLTNGEKGFYAGYNSTSAGGCVAGFTYIVACSDSAPGSLTHPHIYTMSRSIYSG